MQAGKDIKYYQNREKIILRKVELNDKLKAIQLLQALSLDDGHEHDILSQINFNKEPKEVFEDTKTAIRDIVSDKYFAQNVREIEVHVVKPWQEQPRGDYGKQEGSNRYYRGRSREGYSGDRSRSCNSRDRSTDRFLRDKNRGRYFRSRS